jgi:hypothetical protein
MLLAALEELGLDDDIRAPADSNKGVAINALLSGIQEKDFH